MQLCFDFPFQEKYLAEDFLVSKANKSAFDFVVNYDDQHNSTPKIFVICGAKSSGKTHLANIWQKKFDGEFLNLQELENVNLLKIIKTRRHYIIENIDEIKNQELLLHIFNLVQEKMAFLMMTSKVDLDEKDFGIKDLQSRLKNVFVQQISKPDDELIKMLLVKNFAGKQLKVEDKVIDFLIMNLNRDFINIFNAVKLLEFYSREKRRNITIPLIKEVMKIDL